MATKLSDEVIQAFRSEDAGLVQDALTHVVNRASRLMVEANRQSLTEFWKELAAAHYTAERTELSPELREERGYLKAIVHLSKAVRDQSDDLEAIEKVKKCVHGPAILSILRAEGTVQHRELAESLTISAPSLTQAMKALWDSRAITATVHGKFKYYSLTPLGRSVAVSLAHAESLRESIARMKEATRSLPVESRTAAIRRLEQFIEQDLPPPLYYVIKGTVGTGKCHSLHFSLKDQVQASLRNPSLSREPGKHNANPVEPPRWFPQWPDVPNPSARRCTVQADRLSIHAVEAKLSNEGDWAIGLRGPGDARAQCHRLRKHMDQS